jgi:hypothetical protein
MELRKLRNRSKNQGDEPKKEEGKKEKEKEDKSKKPAQQQQ